MIWRIVGIVLNPFALIGWTVVKWLGRKIDGRFGPVLGWYVALFLCLTTGPAVLISSYHHATKPVGRLVGLVEPIQIITVSGRIILAETIEEEKWTLKERVVVRYEQNGQVLTFEESLTQVKPITHRAGEAVTVYLQDGSPPSIKDPDRPIVDAVVAFLGVTMPLAIFLFCLKYLFYRKRIYDQRPARPVAEPAGVQIPPLAGDVRTDRVLSTAERLKADELRIRQMTAKKPGK